MKTLTDLDATRINFTPVSSSVEALGALPRPRSRPQDRRANRTERTVFYIEGWLVAWDPQSDRDVHIVVAGLVDPNARLVAEIPDATCASVCNSGLWPLYEKARTALAERLATLLADTLRVRIMGVGFFDRNHGQVGAASNFIELHPVLAIEFP